MIFPFNPSAQGPFQFQPTLDGQTYTAIIGWNLFGQRYYISVLTLAGERVFTLPLIGSTVGKNVQVITWSNGRAFATLTEAHGYAVGETLLLNLKGAVPVEYDGTYEMLVEDPTTLSFPVHGPLESASVPGSVSFDISLTAGYFDSTLVYHEPSRAIEVLP